MNHLNIKMGAGKTTQKFELNFQKDISEQIKDMHENWSIDAIFCCNFEHSLNLIFVN